MDAAIERQAAAAIEGKPYHAVIHAEAEELRQAVIDWCKSRSQLHITLVRVQANKDDILKCNEEARKVAGRIGPRIVPKTVVITKLSPEAKALKAKVEVK